MKSLSTQHCDRLTENKNIRHAGHLNKNTHTDRKRDNLRTQNYKRKKEKNDNEITQYDCDTGISSRMSSYQDTITE